MWFHNLSNGMDQDSLNKWKEEFQHERQEQFSKVKQLQKDTQKRRKQMELKRKLDAAKEEKRRREALAERRAVHVEATMRFQKGIKNFRVSKEKISLEDALKSLNKRTNSADTSLISNTNTNNTTVNTSDVYSLLLNQRSKSANFNIRSHLRKSSSFNDVNALIANINGNKQQQLQSTLDTQIYNLNNDYKNLIHTKANDDIYKPRSDNNNNNNNNNNYNNTTYNATTTNTTTTANPNNFLTSNITQNVINTNNPGNNFRIILEENQKTIQNFNKEALNDFKNTIMSEVKSTGDPGTFTTTSVPPTLKTSEIPKLNNNFTKHFVDAQANDNHDYQQKTVTAPATTKIITTSSTDELEFNDEAIINDDLSSISSTNNISDSEDSLEIENKPRAKSANVTSTTTRSNGELVTVNKPSVVQIDSNSFNNQISNIKNHFITKTLATDFLTNSLLANKKTYYAPQANGNEGLVKEATTMSERIPPKASTQLNLKSAASNQAPKSILKRSTSENNLHLIGHNNPFLNFAINGKAEKLEVKDSLEIANSRLKPATSTKDLSVNGRKKSVRFAQSDGSSNGDADNESNNTQDDFPNEAVPFEGASKTSNNAKRPSIKPRTSLNNKKPAVTELQILNDSNSSNGKPPLPMSAYANDNSYLLISQKRKEFLDKFRNKNGGINEFLTSPKSPHEPMMTANTINNRPLISNLRQGNDFQANEFDRQFHQSMKQQVNELHQADHTNKVQFNGHPTPENEIKKTENVINTFNNKYGYHDQPNRSPFTRNDTLNEITAPPQQQQQQQIVNGNNKKFPAKPLLNKGYTNNTTSMIEIQQLPQQLQQQHQPMSGTQPIRRPFSANTPLTTDMNNAALIANAIHQNNLIHHQQQNNASYHHTPTATPTQVPRINTKLMTFNITTPASPQRVFSADSSNQQIRYKNPMIQLKIQYPENMKFVPNTAGNNENVTLSMDEFLKAEQMCNSQLTESKVYNILDNMQQNKQSDNQSKPMPTALSIEEQNCKNSIQKLNDKLNLMNRKTNTGLRRKLH